MSNLTSAIQVTRKSTYSLNNGLDIPIIGYGVYRLPQDEASDLVYKALEAGYRHIDTAVFYDNEKEVAQGIQKFLKDHPEVSRGDIWFTTKLFNNQQGYKETRKALGEIADRVKPYIDYVDLVLIHSPLTSKEKRLGTYKALQEFLLDPSGETLHIKSIGVSNYGIAHLEELFNWEGYQIKPVVNQIEVHPWLPQLELRNYLVQHEILVEAYSPLTKGLKLKDPELVALAKKYSTTPADILLKWSFLQGFIVLVKSDKAERIKSNLAVLPPAEEDALGQTSFGKVDLEEEIVNAMHKPDSKDFVAGWGVLPTDQPAN